MHRVFHGRRSLPPRPGIRRRDRRRNGTLRHDGHSQFEVKLASELFHVAGLRRGRLRGQVFAVEAQRFAGLVQVVLQDNGQIQKRLGKMRLALQGQPEKRGCHLHPFNARISGLLQFDQAQSIGGFRRIAQSLGIFIVQSRSFQLPGSFQAGPFRQGQFQAGPAQKQESVGVLGVRRRVGRKIIDGARESWSAPSAGIRGCNRRPRGCGHISRLANKRGRRRPVGLRRDRPGRGDSRRWLERRRRGRATSARHHSERESRRRNCRFGSIVRLCASPARRADRRRSRLADGDDGESLKGAYFAFLSSTSTRVVASTALWCQETVAFN